MQLAPGECVIKPPINAQFHGSQPSQEAKQDGTLSSRVRIVPTPDKWSPKRPPHEKKNAPWTPDFGVTLGWFMKITLQDVAPHSAGCNFTLVCRPVCVSRCLLRARNGSLMRHAELFTRVQLKLNLRKAKLLYVAKIAICARHQRGVSLETLSTYGSV